MPVDLNALEPIRSLLDEIATDLTAYRDKFFEPWSGTSISYSQIATLWVGPGDDTAETPFIIVQNASQTAASNHKRLAMQEFETVLNERASMLRAHLMKLPGIGHDHLVVDITLYTRKTHNRLILEIDRMPVHDQVITLPEMMPKLSEVVERVARIPSGPMQAYLVKKTCVFAPDAGAALYKFACFLDLGLLKARPHELPGVWRIEDEATVRARLITLAQSG